MSITFASKCWEKDWEYMFSAFPSKKDACQYPFDSTLLVINNVLAPEDVQLALLEVANTVCTVSRHLEGIVSSLDLKEAPNWYASGELTALYCCKTDYLCFIQGDCKTDGGDWITPALVTLESEPEVMVVSPFSEVNTWHSKDGYDHYMSDQAFVVRTQDFLNPEVYSYRTLDPDYPSYGGLSFEHLVGNYLKATGKKRKILTDFYTIHPTYA